MLHHFTGQYEIVAAFVARIGLRDIEKRGLVIEGVRIVELFTAGPARCFNFRGRGSLARGSIADVTVFDPKKKWTFDASKSNSKSRNTPFDGWQFTGKVVATIVGAKIVYPG